MNRLLSHKTIGNQIAAKEKCELGAEEAAQPTRASQHGHATTTTSRGKHHGPAVVVAVRRLLLILLPLLLLFLSRPWYLLCYARVESFWTILGIFFDPLGLKNMF